MWHITTYRPVSLVSLKISTATSTGGKSLLFPTPFALKMAVLGIAISVKGVEVGESLWPAIRDGRVAVHGPKQISVNNSFTKILKPMKGKPSQDPDTGLIRPLIKTIGFREYVQWQGSFSIAFAPAAAMPDDLPHWLTMISYLGKRGGFIQAIDAPEIVSELPGDFTELRSLEGQFPLDGTLQIMDDCSPKLSFEQVNIYTSKTIRLGKDRILHHVILPYRLTQSSRGYSLYQRLDIPIN